MFTVTKEFSFEAAHSLPHLPAGHKCQNLHGHSYKVIVAIQGELDDRGFVIDYAEISEVVNPLIAYLDHQNLNELFSWKTTAENLAKWIFCELKTDKINPYSVEVRETEKTSVIYRP